MAHLDLLEQLSLLGRSLKYSLRPRAEPRILRDAPAGEPLISVIIPTYNWSNVLKLAIHSVLWQTEQDFELLVVGDGCTDDSEAVARSFGDARIRWHNLPVNSGHQSAPNNEGVKRARGRYFAPLGHDDVWHPDHLRTLVSKLQSADADLATALVEMIGPEGSNYRVVSGHFAGGKYNLANILPPSGLLIEREAVERIGGWSDYRSTSLNPDLDFLLRLRNTGSRFVSTGELTVFKFNSALRKNSYRERPCHEQAACVRSIENDRLFMLREACRVVRMHVRRLPVHIPNFTPPPDAGALGWEVSQFRKYRGLD
jgi:glycosyltransferase involved in cell wall biosynthesis